MPPRFLRILLPAVALLAMAAPPASAQAPLAGTGENIQPIARVPLAHINEVELAGDWAFVSDEVDGDDQVGGLQIVNIANPEKPFIEGFWNCPGGWADVDISPDANTAILSNGHMVDCPDLPADGRVWIVILDITDKKNPKLLGLIEDDDDISYVHTQTLDNKMLYLNPQAAAIAPDDEPANPQIPIYDISDPANPVRKGFITGRGAGLAHDSYIDHRPDGKDLMYAASIHNTDVFDITDPFNATLLQQTANPEITISHDAQPNHDRSVIVVDDEGAAGGQLIDQPSFCGRVGGPGPAAVDSGSVHFYEAAPDGTFANGGVAPLGSFNAPVNINTGACVAHVFWLAPDQNRMTQAYYKIGGWVIDFEDPANPKALGSFAAEGGGTNYWSFKPHRGYLFGTAQGPDGGLDILKFTGAGWPANAGPAEIQRSARQGVPYVPIKTGGGQAVPTTALPGPTTTVDNRPIGRVKFTAKLKKKLPGKRGKKTRVTFTFFDAKGKKVGAAKVRKPAGKKAKVRLLGGAVAGKYRWTAKAGKRKLGKGRFTVKPTPGMKLATTMTLSVGAR